MLRRMTLSLTGHQIEIVMDAARALPVEKRSLLLERIAAMVNLRGRRVTDNDVIDLTVLALTGLSHGDAGLNGRF